jgi:hypothetical protein
MGKRGGKSPLERSRRKWEKSIKSYFREIGRSVMEWILLAQDTV